MPFDYKSIFNQYDQLSADGSNAWDIYAGEASQAEAERRGVPERQWNQDRAAMQLGQEILSDEIKKGIPQTPEDRKQRICGLIDRMIDGRLLGQANPAAQKGLLLHMLQSLGLVGEEQLAAYSHRSLEDLKEIAVNHIYNYTLDTVFPEILEVLERHYNLAGSETDEQAKVIDNAGALAVAEYLETPEIRSIPEVIGLNAEMLCSCSAIATGGDTESGENFFNILALIFFALSVTFVLILLSYTCGTVISGAALCALEASEAWAGWASLGAGIAANIAGEFAIASDFAIGLLKLALGTSILGGIAKLVSTLMGKLEKSEYYESESRTRLEFT